MTRHHLFLAVPVAAAIATAGCATADAGDYPDLAPRAIEGRLTTVPPEPVPLPPSPPPAATLAQRLAQLSGQTDSADARFRDALPRTQQLVGNAANAAVSSEAWIAAQTAISVLDSERAPVTDALAETDALIIARQDAADRAGMAELAALRDRLEAMVARHRSALRMLLDGLKPA